MAVQTSLVKETASYGVLQKRTSTLCKQNSVVNQCSVRETTVAVPRVSDFYVLTSACVQKNCTAVWGTAFLISSRHLHLTSLSSLTHTHTHTHTHVVSVTLRSPFVTMVTFRIYSLSSRPHCFCHAAKNWKNKLTRTLNLTRTDTVTHLMPSLRCRCRFKSSGIWCRGLPSR